MRFLLDEDVHPKVAEAARSMRLDVVSVHELGRRGLGDREQLELAAAEHRVLVTRNRDDFIKLTISSYHVGEPHPGVLIIPYSLPNKEPGRIARALKRWATDHGDGDTRYGIFFLAG